MITFIFQHNHCFCRSTINSDLRVFQCCDIEKLWLFIQLLFGRILELIIGRKSQSTEVFLRIWKQMVITWCQVRIIWWMTHFFKSYSSKAPCPVCDPVSRYIVMQKKGHLGQLSLALLFNCTTQFVKYVSLIKPYNCHFVILTDNK